MAKSTKPKIDAKAQALKIKEMCEKYGFSYQVRGQILTIEKRFPAGDKKAFVDCDMMYGSVLEQLPRTSQGSDWGTDGGSLGGMTALETGHFRMNRSGGSPRVLNELEKLSKSGSKTGNKKADACKAIFES